MVPPNFSGVFFTLTIFKMDIKLKFPPESIAFFIKSESEFKKMRIKSANITVEKDSVTIMYKTDDNGELPYNQNDLLSRREFSDHINGLN
jgi:hypothetical protein